MNSNRLKCFMGAPAGFSGLMVATAGLLLAFRFVRPLYKGKIFLRP